MPIAHVCRSPALAIRHTPVIGVGRNWFVVLPVPSWPRLPSPQHCIAPALEIEHVCAPPVTMLAATSPGTWVRTSFGCVVLSPSCPLALAPQHQTCPPPSTAHV